MTTAQVDHTQRRVAISQEVLATPDARALGKVATEILKGLDPSNVQIDDLKALIACVELKASDAFLRRHEQAVRILETLVVRPNGFVELTIPAGLSDIDAMKELNSYFRETLPGMQRDAIFVGDFEWCAQQPGFIERDLRKARKIKINLLVEGTLGENRVNQETVLKKAGMTFAAPEEVALVVAAYACKNDGKDLLNDFATRTTYPKHTLETHPDRGVCLSGGHGDVGHSRVGASGVALRANKKN